MSASPRCGSTWLGIKGADEHYSRHCNTCRSRLALAYALPAAPSFMHFSLPHGCGAARVDGAGVQCIRPAACHDRQRRDHANGNGNGRGSRDALRWHDRRARILQLAPGTLASGRQWSWLLPEWPLLLRIVLQRHCRRALYRHGLGAAARARADPRPRCTGAGSKRAAPSTTDRLTPDRGA